MGVVALILSALQGSLNPLDLHAIAAATRLYRMIALILAGAHSSRWPWATSVCRALAEWIGGLGLSHSV